MDASPKAQSGDRPSRWLQRAVWGLALLIVVGGFCGADRVFYERVSQRLNTENNPFDRDFYTVTRPVWIALRYGFGLVGVGLYFYALAMPSPGWRRANAALVSVVVVALIANAVQGAIGRLRPNQGTTQLAFTQPTLNPVAKEKVSFPSGESATAFAMACVLTRLFRRGRIAFYAAATLVAVTRLVNGAHYVSDVVAGALLGVLLGGVVFVWVERLEDRLWPRGDTASGTG